MSFIIYKYRLYPSRKQKEKIINSFKTCKQIYNELINASQIVYFSCKKSMNKYDFNKLTKDKYKIHSQVVQNVSDRVHKAFDNFFRRVKDPKCKKKGYPRFKSRVNSITFPQSGFKLLSDKRLHLSKIGNIPIVLHRIPKGKIKTLTIKQNKIGQWYVFFNCELPDIVIKHPSKNIVGIDVNSKDNFCFLTTDEYITNPKYLVKSEKRIAKLSRIMHKRKKGSANRRKARFNLAKLQLKVANQRLDFQHKLSHTITQKFNFIAVEKLDITSMIDDAFNAKFIHDASWGSFIKMLSYKAVIRGGQVKENPKTRGSSHRCSKCGFYVEDMPLSKRTFHCPNCGFSCHRDLNAANNHLKDTAGLAEIITPVDIEPIPPSNGPASLVVESGTINGTTSSL